MDQRLSVVTLAVSDLQETEHFYVDGLGWDVAFHQTGEVIMVKVADQVILSFWSAAAFEEECGPPVRGGIPPVILAHNVASKDGVDRCLEHARAAGADPVHDALERDWGGYSGYFADPDGYRWEVAYNPSKIGQEVLP